MLGLKIVLIALMPLAAQANVGDVFAELLGRPERGGVKAAYGIRQYETQGLGQSKLGLRQHSAQASVPLNSLSDRRWKLLFDGGLDELRTNARFPNGRPLPNQIWDFSAGVSYMRETSDDRTLGGHFALGSSGDRPFGAFRDYSLQANLFYKVPTENDAAWLFFLGFANDRSFLNYLPLPGFAYFFRPHEKLRLAVGLPFLIAFWSPFDKAAASFTYFPLDNAQAKFSYFIFGPAHAFLQAKYHTKNSFLADRANRKERLFYGEATAEGGFSMPLEKYLLMEGSAGYAFDRKYFLGEDERDVRNGQVLRPGKSPYASIRLVSTF